jgi:hypothetical protein
MNRYDSAMSLSETDFKQIIGVKKTSFAEIITARLSYSPSKNGRETASTMIKQTTKALINEPAFY